MRLFTNSNERNTSLGVVERTSYMMGHIGTVLISTVVAAFLVYYYTDVMHLDPLILGSILLVSRLFDGVTDLIMGYIVDRTHSRYGKGRAWILRACLPYAVSGVLLFSVPGNVAEPVQYIYVFITYNVCNAIFYTAIYVAYNSMMCTITSNQYEHGLLGVFVTFGATLGGMLVQSTIDRATKALGGDARAWQIVVAIYALLGMIFHLICFFFTKERALEAPEEKTEEEAGEKLSLKRALGALFHNKYWILANIFCFMFTITSGFIAGSGMYYVKSVFQDTSYFATIANAMSLTSLVALFISPVFLKRFGKRNTMLSGTIVATAAFVVSGIAGANLVLVTACSAIKGFGCGLLASGAYGAVADTIDYGEWKFGVKAAGIGFSGVSCGTKVANGLASVFLGWIIKASGYNGDLAVQSPKAVLFTNASMNYLPAICYGITIICLVAYKLDKLYPQIQKELEGRREAA